MATEDEQPPGPGRLKALRPGAIVTNKGNCLTSAANAGLEPLTAGGSRVCATLSPGVRVSVANKAGKNREIAKIEPPGKIGDFYDFGSILGQGGFGTVSQILHAKTFQPFAGKVIEKWTKPSHIEEYEAPFRQVMEVLLNHEHTHVVRMLHVFEDESNYYQVMEACQGGTLYRFVRTFERSEIPVKVVEDIGEQVLAAIEFLHKFKMIHRDIKPDNVMLTGTQEAQQIVAGTQRIRLNIVDFDMCRFLDSEGEIKSKHLEGTPGYLAPEVMETRRYSVKSDLFAFGCLWYFVMLHEEPNPEVDFSGAPTCELLANLGRWMSQALDLCAEATATLELVEAEARASSPTNGTNSPKSPKTTFEQAPPGVVVRPSSALRPSSAVRPRSPLLTAGGAITGNTSNMSRQASSSSLMSRQVSPALNSRQLSSFTRQVTMDPLYQGLPVRLWRLLAWCLDVDPSKRPASVHAILLSGYVRGEVASPRSPHRFSEFGEARRERKRAHRKNTASIDDLLKLSVAGR